MTDNQSDEFPENDEFDSEPGFEDFETGRSSLAEAWKTNPLMKLGGAIGAVVVIVGGIMLFGGDAEPVSPSMISGTAKEVKQAPGEKVSEAYKTALEETNERVAEEASRTGQSALPVPIGPSRGRLVEDSQKSSDEDPLERWRKIQEERLRKEQQERIDPANGQQQQTGDPYAAQKQALAASMQTQMESVLESQTPKSPQKIDITPGNFLEEQRRLAAERELQAMNAAQSGPGGTGNSRGTVEILLEAGRIEYAQLLTEANSDVPGPVLAQLASGPLAGSRLIGSFRKQDDYLTLTFEAVVVDGIAISTQAVALDPATAKPGVVTDIDRKYFQRIILPAAAAFIEGLGSAIAENGSTTVTVDSGAAVEESSDLDPKQELFKGVEEASSKLGEILDENADSVETMVKVAAGTQIGVFFTKSVERRDEVAQRVADDERLRQQQLLQQTATGAGSQFLLLPQGQFAPGTVLQPAQGGSTTTGGNQ